MSQTPKTGFLVTRLKSNRSPMLVVCLCVHSYVVSSFTAIPLAGGGEL